jgi:hypothetical protein
MNMRNVQDNKADNDFRKFLSFHKSSLEDAIVRLSRLEDKTSDRRRISGLGAGSQQFMGLEFGGGSIYATVGTSLSSTVVGS